LYDFKETDQYADWFNGITDERAKDRINARIHSAKNGNFGVCESVGEGVVEMKLHYGPGDILLPMREGRFHAADRGFQKTATGRH